MQKPIVDGETVYCEKFDMNTLEMDPMGYFLIRVCNETLEVGLCSYNTSNTVKRVWMGKLPQDIYMKVIIDCPEIWQEHAAYLGKELARAYICMHMGITYIQDGRIDGSFQETSMLVKKYEKDIKRS